MTYTADFIEQYSHAVPRYTSYPTAPHFSTDVKSATVRKWMSEIRSDERISLYIHIPFCDRLCWFCGCHTKHTLKYDPIKAYLETIYEETRLIAKTTGRKQVVGQLHLGGGSPSLLRPDDLAQLKRNLLQNFQFMPSTEISLEFDPTDLTATDLKAFAAFGVTRASIGVQDFNPKVQKAINRPQTFEQTRRVVNTLRDLGVTSINIDALYGLPHQTTYLFRQSLHKVISLDPDRVALFGYAHVPWVKPHQKLITEDALPDNFERFRQARIGERMLKDAGYDAIGLDHFAKPEDSLAIAAKTGHLRRNFQGYTADQCQTLIGLGTSSISQYREGYSQNIKDVRGYKRSIAESLLPITRGITLSQHDRLIATAIEELMCNFTLSPTRLASKFGSMSDMVIMRAESIAEALTAEIFYRDGEQFKITPYGKPFVRTIASYFDEYLTIGSQQYSIAV